MAAPASSPPPGWRAGVPFPAPGREIFSWCMFDFANSSFTTVIVTVVFGVYFTKLVCGGGRTADLWWSVAVWASQSVVLVTAPLLGAVADFSGAKKRFLTASWLVCCAFTAALWFVGPGDVLAGVALFLAANVAFSVGENLTASFLPELARPEDMGKVSGYGWAWGYLGGLVSLALCVPLIRDGFEMENLGRLRLTNVVIGAFFFAAALPTILFLRERKEAQTLPPGETYLTVGFHRVAATLRLVRNFQDLARFLPIFFVYNCGITIIIAFAAIYAEKQLRLSPFDLLFFFLEVQITSAVGAFVFGFVQDRWGARRTIQISLAMWMAVIVGCWLVPPRGWFFVVGNLAGLCIGSSQSAARALVGTFSPPSQSAEFFGFWGLFWKAASALGPLVFGAVSAISGSQRFAIAVTGVFFLAGFIGMFFVDEAKGRAAAATWEARSAGREV